MALLTGSVLGLPVSGSGAPRGPLADSLSAILAEGAGQARWGVLAVSLTRGDTLVALDAARRLVPASNVKLLTTGAFLKWAGTNHLPPTVLEARGDARTRRRDGEAEVSLKGELSLRGSGMPDVYQLLAPGSRGLLDSVALLLRASGLRSFEGTLWVDGNRLKPEPFGLGWAIDDMPFSYGAPLNAILANGNAATVVAEARGGEVALRLEPPETPLILSGRVAPADPGSPPRLFVSRAPGSRTLRVSGSLPPGTVVKRQVATVDPDSTAGLLLLGAMRRAGIKVKASVRVVAPQEGAAPNEAIASGWDAVRKGSGPARVLSLAPPPAAALVATVNAYSLNVEAEALLRSLDPAPWGKSGAGGLAAVKRMLAESGVDTLDVSLVDGSGLSPLNLVTARALVRWLSVLDHDTTLSVPFRDTLASPGGVGTLERRGNGLPGGAVLRAKSGTLTNVSALSGYLTRPGGERIAFAILSNGNRGSVAPARAVEERFLELLARYEPAKLEPSPVVGIPR